MRYFGILIILGVLFSVNANTDKKYESRPGHSHYITRKKAMSRNIPQTKSILSYRDQLKDSNESDKSLQKLTVIYNGDSGIIATVNTSSSIALIIDYTENLIQLTNNQSQVSILVDYNTNTTYQLNDTSNKTPLQSLSSLKPILESAQQTGQGSKLRDLPPAISHEIITDITNLAGSFSPNSLQYVRTIIEQLNKGRLNLLYKGKGSFDISKDLGTFARLNSALGDFLAAADDLHSIASINSSRIFSPKTGFGTFLAFLDEIGKQDDLTKVFGGILKSPDKIIRLGTQVMAAVSHEGIDGLDVALTNIVMFLQGKGSIKDAVRSVLEYIPNRDITPKEIQRYITYFEDIIQNQLTKYNNSEALGSLSRFLSGIKNNTLVISHINISDVITLLSFRSPREVLESGIKILRGLFTFENFSRMIQPVFNSSVFHQIVSDIFPGLSFDNLSGLFSNTSSLVSKIPVFGPMLSSNFERWMNFVRNIGESFGNVWPSLLKDIRNGYFGEESLGIWRRVANAIRKFIENIVSFWKEQMTNPLAVIDSLTNIGSSGSESPVTNSVISTTAGEGDTVPEFLKPLSTVLGLRKKHMVAQIKHKAGKNTLEDNNQRNHYHHQ